MNELTNVTPWLVAVPAVVLVALLVFIAIIKNLLYICRPNEILIFSGRKQTSLDGRSVGFRVVAGGRGFRVPLVESVSRMDISLISVPMTVTGAYSEGGIPLSLHAIANIKVSSDPRVVGNAIERFLGHGRSEIGRVAKETLEGHLRGVLATMTPEEVNEDRLKFAKQLFDEAGPDLEKLGLELDTLKIQHVADDRNYLESIGRKRIAEIIRAAEVAESDAVRAAEEAEASARARGQVAQTNAQANVQRKANELRQIAAELDGNCRAEEERAQAAGHQARAEAERELQRIRGELAQLRLEVDVTIPADIERQVREQLAAGEAAQIATDGEAMASSLATIAAAWQESSGKAMDMFVLQNLEGIFDEVANAAKNIKVRNVSLVDGGDGATLPNYVASYPAIVSGLLAQVSQTLGVDIGKVITGQASGPAAGAVPALPHDESPRAPTLR